MTKSKTILVIDDEEDLVDIIKYELEAQKYKVLTANDGVEGLEIVKSIKPDLIILDMNMPKMGGIEFYNNILNIEGKAEFPVLVLTARANLEDMFKDFSVEGFLTKPFEISELLSEVRRIVEG